MSLIKCEKLHALITTGNQIPYDLWAELPDRLTVAFYAVELRWGKKLAKVREETEKPWNLSRRRKAHKIYARVLQEVPHFFLIFILNISPRSCNASLADGFIDKFKKFPPVALDPEARRKIESAAKRVEQLPDFEKWIALIFQKPLIVDEKHLTYGSASIDHLERSLGDKLFRYVQVSSKREKEMVRPSMHDLTECALTCVSLGARDDIILQLDIGHAHQLAEELFSATFQKSLSLNSQSEVFLTRAQISEAKSIFSPTIWTALNDSLLRSWERLGLNNTRTECISLKLNCKDKHNGVLSLRLASHWSEQVLELYFVE
ncbi:hypothetical protein V8C42DRAFT_207295 [Trichoderma barbatum]